MLDIELFEKIPDNDILALLQCTGIKTKIFKKNSVILSKNANVDYIGVIMEGKAKIITPGGLVENLKTNDIFAHNIVCLGIKKSPVDIVTENGCEVLFLPYEKVVTPCSKLCSYHLQLIKNIMKTISRRNSLLSDKIDIIAQKTTREKFLSFLKSYDSGDKIITLPMSREETARFLCVDRSALSREICKLRDEGVLKFYKNRFELL